MVEIRFSKFLSPYISCVSLLLLHSIWQDIFNLLPNLDANDLSAAMSATTSDQMLVVYLATLLRASIALHNLINNKVCPRGFLGEMRLSSFASKLSQSTARSTTSPRLDSNMASID